MVAVTTKKRAASWQDAYSEAMESGTGIEEFDPQRGPFACLIDITPDLAGKWLDRNTDNYRRQRAARISVYEDQIKSGRWRLNHQGIAFNSHGKLIDGQHRLWAIFSSEVTVRTLVCFGFDEVETLDRHLIRNVMDTATALGVNTDKDRMTIARCLMEMNGATIDQSRIIEFYQANKSCIDRAADVRSTRFKKRALGQSSIWCAVAIAYDCGIPDETMQQFFQTLDDGQMTDNPGSESVYRFRDHIREKLVGGGTARRRDCMLALAVILSVRDRRRMMIMRTPSEWPIKMKAFANQP